MAFALDGCQIAPGVLIDPIDCELPRFGLLSVADLPNPPAGVGEHWRNGVEWSPYDCNMAETFCNKCESTPEHKVYHEQNPLKKGLPFEVYGSFKCSGPGWTAEEMQRRARMNLELGEQRRIEREFIHSLQNSDPVEPDTVDLSPAGGAVSLVAGMAALEDYAGEFMACLPTIHTPRGLVTNMAAASIFPTSLADTKLRTYLGTLVSAGGGYDNLGPDGTPAPAGEAWLYVTGPVHIWLGDVVDVPDTGQAASRVDRSNNDLFALAERTVVTGFECAAAAIRVSLGNPFGC